MALNTNDAINILNTDNALGLGSGGSFIVAGGTSIGKDLYVGGNISISGTATAFNDNMIILNNNTNISTDTGILFQRFSGDIFNNKSYSSIIYSETDDKFLFRYLSDDPGKNLSTHGNYISLQAYSLSLENTDDSLGIGSGGGLTVSGGVAISKNTNIGGDIIVSGNINLTGNLYKNNNLYASDSLWESSNNNIFYTKGNVGIGTTVPTYTLHVMGPIYSSDRITAFSDVRFKENIKTLDSCVSKVNQCRGVSYIKTDTGEKHLGFIAQELEKIFPELVVTDEFSGFKSVAYGNMTAVLLECIKELSEKVKKLEMKQY